jgi:hypothetical protein
MPGLTIEITQYLDDSFPGWAECVLIDAFSNRHLFREKGPVVTAGHLGPHEAYPQRGTIACAVEAEWKDDAGRCVIRVNTKLPLGVESIAGETRFVVLRAQVTGDESGA